MLTVGAEVRIGTEHESPYALIRDWLRQGGRAGRPLAIEARAHFDRLWNNTDGRTYSLDYETHADEGAWLKLQYRTMEATGLSTF